MKRGIFSSVVIVFIAGCASPPKSNPSLVDSSCAQQCSNALSTCSSGFKLFPVVQQQQCNDNYDVCISGCPAKNSDNAAAKSISSRLKELDNLYNSGSITEEEYNAKRQEILSDI